MPCRARLSHLVDTRWWSACGRHHAKSKPPDSPIERARNLVKSSPPKRFLTCPWGGAPGFTGSTTNTAPVSPARLFRCSTKLSLIHRCGPDARSRAAMGHAKATAASPCCRLHCPSALPTLPNFSTLLAWRVPPCLTSAHLGPQSSPQAESCSPLAPSHRTPLQPQQQAINPRSPIINLQSHARRLPTADSSHDRSTSHVNAANPEPRASHRYCLATHLPTITA